MDNMKQYTKMLNNTAIIMPAVFAIIFIVVLMFTFYIYSLSRMRPVKCDVLEDTYPNSPPISSLQNSDYGMKFLLRDFYIKSSYNSCSIGNFKNNFVDICALKNVIKQGVRCFDFEIYSLDDEPIVSTSSIDNYYVKQTYNYIPFIDVLKTLNSMGFSSSSPTQNDPLFIHMRIKSKNNVIYDKMAKYIKTYLDTNRILSPQYSNEYNGKNLGKVQIKELMGKFIFITDRSNKMYVETKLFEYINIATNSMFMRGLRNYGVEYTPDHNELVEYNKKQMTLSMPDLSSSTNNVKAAIHMNYGCQFICMCYQNRDSNMEYIDKFFSENNRALVLKPEKLRYVQVTIAEPKKQDPNLSYATRNVEADYYNFNI
jgi:hypothetical protein